MKKNPYLKETQKIPMQRNLKKPLENLYTKNNY